MRIKFNRPAGQIRVELDHRMPDGRYAQLAFSVAAVLEDGRDRDGDAVSFTELRELLGDPGILALELEALATALRGEAI